MNPTEQDNKVKIFYNSNVVNRLGSPPAGPDIIHTDNEIPPELTMRLERPRSPEATRQMIHNIAGFFSQVAVWDAQQACERRAA